MRRMYFKPVICQSDWYDRCEEKGIVVVFTYR